MTAPTVDPNGFFFSANTMGELRSEDRHAAAADSRLASRLGRHRDAVQQLCGGADADFGKPTPQFRIATRPFYAAWGTPTLHDARSGLRINGKCEVLDLSGKVIPGLYAAGKRLVDFVSTGAVER